MFSKGVSSRGAREDDIPCSKQIRGQPTSTRPGGIWRRARRRVVMKRRVQAQRKFAQGAYIPPQNNNNIPARNDVTLTPPKEDRNIIHNNLSAKNLLDIVSFQSMHTHSMPVVLLERMAPVKDPPLHTRREVPVKPQPTAEHHHNRFKSKISARNSTMCLRSRTRVQHSSRTKVQVKRLTNIKRQLRQKQKIIRPNLRSKPKRQPDQKDISSSDIDDETPLKFFKNQIRSPKRLPSESADEEIDVVRVTRSSANQDKLNDTCNMHVSRADSDEPLVRPAASPNKRINNVIQRDKQLTEKLNGDIAKPASETTEVPDSELAEIIRDAFKEPALPSRFLRPSSQTDPKLDSRKRFYGPVGIKRWLDWKINVVCDDPKLDDRMTTPPPDSAKSESIRLHYSPSPSVCPSDSIRTIKDAVQAPESILKQLCQNCRKCLKVETIKQIASLMQKAKMQATNGDVYEFNGNDDKDSEKTPFCSRKRNSRNNLAQDITAAKTTSEGNDDEYHFYLDVLPDSPHVVQMTSIKVPNATRRIMRARLVSRTDAHATQDFSLTEHEGLFDQLLNSLRTPESYPNEEQDSKINNKNPQPSTSKPYATRTSNKTTNKPHLKRPSGEKNLQNLSEPSTSKDARYGTRLTKSPEPAMKGKTRGSGKSKAKTNENSNTSAETLSDNNSVSYPESVDGAKLVEAPVFYMTEQDFDDPITFFEKIMPQAAKYGLCKVVAPDSFKPNCVLNDALKFNVYNQYIGRLYYRWGPAVRDMSSMKAYLASQNVTFVRVPLLESLEVNLPKLYWVVQRHGGLNEVIEKKRWGRVAEEMHFAKGPNTEKMLDNYYVKYLLPYETATNAERQHIMGTVEKCWHKKHSKLLDWALNPLHHQKKLLGESDTSEEETDEQEENIMRALSEAEDCVVSGRSMNLSGFKKVANHANIMYMPHPNANTAEIEKEYWRLVLFGTDHVCVNSASIDTDASSYGFGSKTDKTDPFAKHPWNLKMLSSNNGNVLRSLDAVLGVTVPTLHLGMVFSTSCWHRDPHGLPWMEYMHEGPAKIWYGIPDEQSSNFRKAVESLCPTSCQNKSIWLSSDITMIPPNLLREHNVSLSRAVQNPGEFIIVIPKAYSCSISTGFTVSESVYFATTSWLQNVTHVFKELRESCEPTTFSLEQLLIALGKDPRAPLSTLELVYESLTEIVDEEIKLRSELVQFKITKRTEQHLKKRGANAAWNVREQAECRICRKTLYLSKVTGLIAKKTALCLVHAVQLLKTPKYRNCDVASIDLVTFFSDKQLQEIVTAIHKRLNEKMSQPHSSNKC